MRAVLLCGVRATHRREAATSCTTRPLSHSRRYVYRVCCTGHRSVLTLAREFSSRLLLLTPSTRHATERASAVAVIKCHVRL